MKYTLLFVYLSLTLFSNISAQSVDLKTLILDKEYTEKLEKNIISRTDSFEIFRSSNDHQSLFYYAIIPKLEINGAIVLFSSLLEEPESVISAKKDFIQMASDNNFIIIIPSINSSLYIDNSALFFLNKTFDHAINKYKIPKNKFILGGFSLGGIISLRYTEIAYENNSMTSILPKMVFNIDGPVDYIPLYWQYMKDIENNVNPSIIIEAHYFIENMNRLFGGSPDNQYMKYVSNSVYSHSEESGGNIKYLKEVPIRIYSDPDIDWYIKYRSKSLYEMNALGQTSMIVELNRMGNKKAEFINCIGKGYRPNGMRHPHSWNNIR